MWSFFYYGKSISISIFSIKRTKEEKYTLFYGKNGKYDFLCVFKHFQITRLVLRRQSLVPEMLYFRQLLAMKCLISRQPCLIKCLTHCAVGVEECF